MRAAPPRAGCILRQIKFGGHCTKKSEPTSSRTPSFARAACVVALTRKVRSDRVRTPPRAEYRASRPLALPLLSILIFLRGGEFLKRNGRQGRGAASTPQNRIYQTGIFHNRLYRDTINMSKKYLAKYQKLTQKLRSARFEAGLTQVEAGKKLKKPQAYLSKIERGERGVDAVELGELARVYGKSLNYFIK